MKKLLYLLFIFSHIHALAQYTSPGTGLVLDMDELVAISAGTVIYGGGGYEINADLTIAGIDTLRISSPAFIYIAPEVLITIEGSFIVQSSTIFSGCCEGFYEGFRLEESAHTRLTGALFEYGGGIRVLGGDFEMDSCTVRFQNAGVSTGGALGLSKGKPVITNSTFAENEASAISSSANVLVAPIIKNNSFSANNTANANRPQINLGPSGADTTVIEQNGVSGFSLYDQTGGIGFSSLTGLEAHVVISENSVLGNRYGIAVIGSNIYSRIENNAILENTIQNEPNLGGSGINFNNSDANGHIVLGNTIMGNLWGITLQGNAEVNLGEIDNLDVGPGNNVFQNNGNNGAVYALYNNTTNNVWAQENCWDGFGNVITEEEAENVIFHAADDPELGEVFFLPSSQCIALSSENVDFSSLATLYPNPASNRFTITSKQPMQHLELSTVQGISITSINLASAERVELDVSGIAPGLYLVRLWGQNFTSVSRVIVE